MTNSLMKCLMIICFFQLQLTAAPTAIVTGASRGIGFATAEALAERGYHVYGIVRSPMDHPMVHFEALDLRNEAEIEALVEKIGRIDVLINNAGYALAGPIECLSMEEIREQIDVNFMAPIRMIQAVVPEMSKEGSGKIINISSEQGVYGLPFGSLYTASKAALESLSEALYFEVLPWNIQVSIVEPGLVQTNFTIKTSSKKMEEYKEVFDAMESEIEMRKEGTLEGGQTAEEIALFLLKVLEEPSPKLRYQTSKEVEQMVSIKLKDLSGDAYLEKMKEIFSREK